MQNGHPNIGMPVLHVGLIHRCFPPKAVIYALVRDWTNSRLKAKGIDGNGNPVHVSGQDSDSRQE